MNNKNLTFHSRGLKTILVNLSPAFEMEVTIETWMISCKTTSMKAEGEENDSNHREPIAVFPN